jgi:hypothetical protein
LRALAQQAALDSTTAAGMNGAAPDAMPAEQSTLIPATQDLTSADTTSVRTAGAADETALEPMDGHFATRTWPTRGVKIDVSELVIADTIGEIDGSTALTLRAARSVPLDMTFQMTKTLGDTPARMYLLMTPARHDRGASCYASTLRQEDGTTEYHWQDQVTAPRIRGTYMLVLALSDGEECFGSPLLWRSKPLMMLTVQ